MGASGLIVSGLSAKLSAPLGDRPSTQGQTKIACVCNVPLWVCFPEVAHLPEEINPFSEEVEIRLFLDTDPMLIQAGVYKVWTSQEHPRTVGPCG